MPDREIERVTVQPEDFERARRLSRRRMARISFAALLIEAAVILLGLFVGGPLFAANLQAASTILVGMFWAQAALVGAYLGVSLAEALKRP